MALYLEQKFPLGRFHATRWNQGAFGDRYGEWPPSPWRLLRALACRWFQWSRETGNVDKDQRDELLRALAVYPPEFYFSALSWNGPPIKQYLPTNVAWTDASKKSSAYKKSKVTLNEDHFRAVPPDDNIYWVWNYIEDINFELLDALLARVLYFGRAESWTQIKRIDKLPQNSGAHCILEEEYHKDMIPVMSALPGTSLNIDSLLATTENPILKDKTIPPGTIWLYARIPEPPKTYNPPRKNPNYPTNLKLLQFAVGGHVFPLQERWTIVTGRFRGTVLAERFRQITGIHNIAYKELTIKQKESVQLLSGKGVDGRELANHQHAYFSILPDEYNRPKRLIVWRDTPFTQDEIAAFMKASQKEIGWDYSTPKWTIRLIPLPFKTAYPSGFIESSSHVWKSLTPFVPPLSRHRFRKNGKERPGETPETIIIKLLQKVGLPTPTLVETQNTDDKWIVYKPNLSSIKRKITWVSVHQSLHKRLQRKMTKERNVAPGFFLRLTFSEPVSCPLILGESSHFGLGLFVPADEKEERVRPEP